MTKGLKIECCGLSAVIPEADDPAFDAKFARVLQTLEQGVVMSDEVKKDPCTTCIEHCTFKMPEDLKSWSSLEEWPVPEAKNHSYVGHSNIEGFVVGIRLGNSGVSKSAITFSGETDIFKAKALAEKSAIFFSPAYSSVKECTILGGTVREAYHAYQALSPWRKVWFAFKAALFGVRS
jgi:hypothetical protein